MSERWNWPQLNFIHQLKSLSELQLMRTSSPALRTGDADDMIKWTRSHRLVRRKTYSRMLNCAISIDRDINCAASASDCRIC
jgi:hypothetical protein